MVLGLLHNNRVLRLQKPQSAVISYTIYLTNLDAYSTGRMCRFI